jgi:hypothetical protein
MKKVGRRAVLLAILMAFAIMLGPQRGEARTDPSKFLIPEEGRGPQQIGDPDGGGGGVAIQLAGFRARIVMIGPGQLFIVFVSRTSNLRDARAAY